jgi:hypothetical protein
MTVRITSYILQWGVSIFTSIPTNTVISPIIVVLLYTLIFTLSMFSLAIDILYIKKRHRVQEIPIAVMSNVEAEV